VRSLMGAVEVVENIYFGASISATALIGELFAR
jgi:hypothetical protein